MSPSANASAVLDREFLMLRSRLIDLAAALDRIDRAAGSTTDDPRMQKIRRSLEILSGSQPGRAEQVQMVFSLPYDPQWQTKYAMEKP